MENKTSVKLASTSSYNSAENNKLHRLTLSSRTSGVN